MPDWRVNKNANMLYTTNENNNREKDDFYATDPNSLIRFLEKIKEDSLVLGPNIWECACGSGVLSDVLKKYGYNVLSTDLVDRGYGGAVLWDFLKPSKTNLFRGDILTNPPYKYALEFVKTALDYVPEGNKVIMFLKISFLEGQERKKFYQENPPKYIYVFSDRQTCYINGDFSVKKGSTVCYCWYVWEKGFKGEPVIRWL